MPRLSKKSQSLIEYSFVIILVMAGLMLMRPYAIRAINAHMKSWDDSVSDSMKDPLLEAPLDSVPVPSTTCGLNGCEPGETPDTCCLDCHGDPADEDNFCCDVRHGGTEDVYTASHDCGMCGDRVCNRQHGRIPENSGPYDIDTNPGGCCEDCSTCGDNTCCTALAGPVPTQDIRDAIKRRDAAFINRIGPPIGLDAVGPCRHDCPHAQVCDCGGDIYCDEGPPCNEQVDVCPECSSCFRYPPSDPRHFNRNCELGEDANNCPDDCCPVMGDTDSYCNCGEQWPHPPCPPPQCSVNTNFHDCQMQCPFGQGSCDWIWWAGSGGGIENGCCTRSRRPHCNSGAGEGEECIRGLNNRDWFIECCGRDPTEGAGYCTEPRSASITSCADVPINSCDYVASCRRNPPGCNFHIEDCECAGTLRSCREQTTDRACRASGCTWVPARN